MSKKKESQKVNKMLHKCVTFNDLGVILLHSVASDDGYTLKAQFENDILKRLTFFSIN